MYRKNPDAAKRIHDEELVAKQKALILVGETLLLSTIRFDFNIQHPYEPLKFALKNLGISQKEVRQTAMSLVNDTLPTTLGVQFKPHYIAAGSLFLAAKFHNIILPSQNDRVWWHKFDVAPKQLQAVTQQMSELFKKRGPCPVIKPAPTSVPTDKQQIKLTPTPTPMDKHQIKLTPTPMDRHQIKPTPAPMYKQQIKPTPIPMDKHRIKSTPAPPMYKQQIKLTPAPPMYKQQIKLTPSPMDKQQIKPTPIPTDGQQIISSLDPDRRHILSSRRRFSNSNTEASRHVPVGSSFDSKSTGRSARNEENQYQSMNEENQYHRMNEEKQGRRKNEEYQYRRMNEEDQYRRTRINHNLDIVAELRLEEQSYWETNKADRACHLRGGSKDTNATNIKDLTRQKRRIQEVGGFGVIVFETNAWKKQKIERR